MLETRSGVVALADIAKVIDEGLHGGIVFPVDVLCTLLAEGALLQAWVCAALLLLLGHEVGEVR